jgi:hypothetical protein
LFSTTLGGGGAVAVGAFALGLDASPPHPPIARGTMTSGRAAQSDFIMVDPSSSFNDPRPPTGSRGATGCCSSSIPRSDIKKMGSPA